MMIGTLPALLSVSEANRRCTADGLEQTELPAALRAGTLPAYFVGSTGPVAASLQQVKDCGYGYEPRQLMVKGAELGDWLRQRLEELAAVKRAEEERDQRTPTIGGLAREIVGEYTSSAWGPGVDDCRRHHDAVTTKVRELFQAAAESKLAAVVDAVENGRVMERDRALTVAQAWQFVSGGDSVSIPYVGRVWWHSVRVDRAEAASLGFAAPVAPAQQSKPTPKQELAEKVAEVDRATGSSLQWPELFQRSDIAPLCRTARVSSAEALRKLAEVRALKLPPRPIGRGKSKGKGVKAASAN